MGRFGFGLGVRGRVRGKVKIPRGIVAPGAGDWGMNLWRTLSRLGWAGAPIGAHPCPVLP